MPKLSQEKNVVAKPISPLATYDLVFGYLFLTQKMKLYGINRYEWEVIISLNRRFMDIGLPKLGVLQCIHNINAAYIASRQASQQKKETAILKGLMYDEQGNPVEPSDEDLSDLPPDQDILAKYAIRVLKQEDVDYFNIMQQYTNRTSYRLTVSINPNSSEFSVLSVQDPLSRLKAVTQSIDTLISQLLNEGIGSAYCHADSILNFTIKKVTSWDMQAYFDAVKGISTQLFCEAFDIQTKGMSGGVELPLCLFMVVQYVELHPEHISTNVLLGLLLMKQTIECYIEQSGAVTVPDSVPLRQAYHKQDGNKILSALTKLFNAQINENPVVKKGLKKISASDGANVPINQNNVVEDGDLMPARDGLLHFANIDEGNFILIKSYLSGKD